VVKIRNTLQQERKNLEQIISIYQYSRFLRTLYELTSFLCNFYEIFEVLRPLLKKSCLNFAPLAAIITQFLKILLTLNDFGAPCKSNCALC
jgi:hypothetical protein